MKLTTNNLLIFGVLGLGAFWFMSQRRAMAAPTPQQPLPGGRYAASPNPVRNTTAANNAAGWGQAVGVIANAWNTITGTIPGTNRGTLGTGTSAEADGTTGEAAARKWYLDNQDTFAVNPPVVTPDMYARAQQEGNSEY